MEGSYYHVNSFFQLLMMILSGLLLWQFVMMSKVEASSSVGNNGLEGFYVFGDSTVDPGNNNYLKTIFKSNFPPYGRDFPNHVPTGRFTNGKLATDYIASYSGLKKEFLPAYLDPKVRNTVEELMSGVSFASAGSGYDPLTPTIPNVISIATQLEYFRELKRRLEGVIGKEGTEKHIKNSVFLVSAATNDFVVNYFGLPIRRQNYTVSTYQQFLIQNLKDFLQELWEEGGRRIAVVGLPPMGCLPVMITLNSDDTIDNRGCIDRYSSVARDYNILLQNEIRLMQSKFSNKIYYIDIYGPLVDMIQSPHKYGFDDVDSGCCGSGYIETAILCNDIVSSACSDASKYVFWDSIHPTEKAYHNVFMEARDTIDFIINDTQHSQYTQHDKTNTPTTSSWQMFLPSSVSASSKMTTTIINSYAIIYPLLFLLVAYAL